MSCYCMAAKKTGRRNAGWKDKGIPGMSISTAPNQNGFLDMWGPFTLRSGEQDCAAVIMDGFDGLMEASPMRYEFGGATAFAVIKFVFFAFTLRHGHLDRITHDRGSNLNSRLNKLHAMVHNLLDCAVFAYAPWSNKVEKKMKLFGNGARLQVLRKQVEAMSDAKAMVADVVRGGDPDYRQLIRLAVAANNEVPNKITGFSPCDLRSYGGRRIVLDSALRIRRFLELEEKGYVNKEGIVNYDEYRRLMKKVQREILRIAKLRKYSKLNHLFEKTGDFAAKKRSIPIKVGAHVIVKRPFRKKSDVENRIGFVVKRIERSGNKWKYEVVNEATGEEMRLPRAHLEALHGPPHYFDKNAAERLQAMEESFDE